MRILYDIAIFFYNAVIHLAALSGNKKAQLWCEGRKNWEEKFKGLRKDDGREHVWFHCASLGEFEQGRPLIEKLRSHENPPLIILSFFSPSGYEIRKNYPFADIVCYLPLDTKKNAKRFIDLASPSYIIFIKYEFWPHYFDVIKKKNIPLYMVSVILRPSQVFFKWYGTYYRNILKNVSRFFVQDENTASLLSENGFNNYTVSGDTRFDRVRTVTLEKKNLPVLEKFKGNSRLLIAGSTWAEDEEILLSVLGTMKMEKLKIVIAPHEVNEKRIDEVLKNASQYFDRSEILRYSSGEGQGNEKVLIIDTIGILSSIYRYGIIAWVGGGFGKGIHNILEAASYGLPVIFGPNYLRFREAVELISLKGAYYVKDNSETKDVLSVLLNDDDKLTESGSVSMKYVNSNTGATDKILSSILREGNDEVLKERISS